MPHVPIPGTRFVRVYSAIAGLLAATYAVLWISISTLMERTFNLTVWDLGANYVLTNMSAPPGLDYGHLKSAPQNLIYLAFTPLTRIFPNPMVLVYAEDLLMAIGGFVIYLIAAEVWGSRSRALLVEGLFLFNYSLFGAPFYPNHYEILFSVFFPIAYLLHLKGWPAASAVFLVVAALTSSLGAVMVGIYVGLLLGPRFIAELRGRGLGVTRFLLEQRFALVVGIAAVAIFAFPFAVQGPTLTLSYDHLAGSPGAPSLLGGLPDDLSAKILGLTLLVVPFLPVIRRCRYVLMVLPYAGLTLFSVADHYAQFSYQYLYIVGAVLFIAWIEALRFRYTSVPISPKALDPTSPPSRPRVRRWRLPGRISREPELLQMSAIVIGLGFFILPYSPGNAFAGGYYSIPFRDYHFPALVTQTSYDQALWGMTERVPTNASVLIQEDMPMLTNRAVWYEPGSYDGEPVQYALTDPSTFWFNYTPPGFIGPYPTPMITWVNDLLSQSTYGIVEEYKGAILLERGYTAPTASFVPDDLYDPGVAFKGVTASYSNTPPGVVHVDRLTKTTGLLRTEGPLVLSPGTFSLSFWLSSTAAPLSDQLTLGLWTNTTSPVPLVTERIDGSALSAQGAWTLITLDFTRSAYQDGVFFGLYGDWNTGLSLLSVYLNQTAAR